jgi:hypothetical protein
LKGKEMKFAENHSNLSYVLGKKANSIAKNISQNFMRFDSIPKNTSIALNKI